jgi:hypothetical protein
MGLEYPAAILDVFEMWLGIISQRFPICSGVGLETKKWCENAFLQFGGIFPRISCIMAPVQRAQNEKKASRIK